VWFLFILALKLICEKLFMNNFETTMRFLEMAKHYFLTFEGIKGESMVKYVNEGICF
jgi:hypothetical protein